MPTSSQALAFLKHIADSKWVEQATEAASISTCHLPNLFPERYDNSEDTDPTSSVSLRVHGDILQQRPERRPRRIELVLPPINQSATQPLALVTHESRTASEAPCNKQELPSTRWKEGSEDDVLTLVEHCNEITNSSQLEQAAESLQESTYVNSDLLDEAQHGHPPSPTTGLDYNRRVMPGSPQSSQRRVPDSRSQVWTPGEASLLHNAPDTGCRRPMLTCVLNLNLWDQSPETHYDDSSCIGILSYNHQMGRHEWSLVPQNSPMPFRAVRGRYIKTRDCLEGSVMSAVPDKSGNFNDWCQSMKGSDVDVYMETAASQVSDSTGEEEMGERKELLQQEDNERPQTCNPVDMHAAHSSRMSSHFQFGRTLIKQDHQEDDVSLAGDNTGRSQTRTQNERLKPSGIIHNESYFFEKDESEDTAPRFLETLISAPKSGEEMNNLYFTNIVQHGHFCEVPSVPILRCQRCRATHRPSLNRNKKNTVQARFTARKTKHNRVNSSSKEASAPDEGKCQPLEQNNSKREEHVDKKKKPQEPVDSCEVPAAQAEANTFVSAPIEPRVLHMRTELPPSHPNRLCFRTSVSGCSHMEVLHDIESQTNVKVTWLQYEPVSLHYTDVTRPDYHHLCMWLFELSSDSDAARLLLEGFRLRGQHMNVLRLDDVYLEEYRTFSLCNEIFMEQRSKHLIKDTPKRLAKGGIYVE
ncbi:hypothetical protein BsWGS_12215 [Bradybaena similaris]